MMIKRYGPFTPQELDRLVPFLRQENIHFEIVKDDKAEREFTLNDGQNAVTRADLRTEIYLAQIFFVEVEDLPLDKLMKIEGLVVQPEEIPQRFKQNEKVIEFESEVSLAERLNRAARQKRIWAAVLFLLIVVPMLLTWLRDLWSWLNK